jgi:hypothetical protein
MAPTPDSPHAEAPDRQPLVGRVVHLAIVLATIAGCGLLTRSLGDGARAALVGAAGAVVAAALWFGTGAAVDPERSPFARVSIPGGIRLGLEVVLVVVAGIGIWIAWNRAAGETFYTVAAIDFAVRYPRIATLLRAT